MNMKDDMITNSRIKKTKLFFENRQYFMEWMVDEIKSAKKKADKMGYHFSVRLNNTSDLSPESFYMDVNGKKLNVLQLFPEIMFYDYTKVAKRFRMLEKYPNYDLTYSFSGHNMFQCLDLLDKQKGRVAMVFEGKVLPVLFMGYKVIDGDAYDMRYLDEQGVIVGLKFKKVRNKIDTANNKFIIPMDSKFSVYEVNNNVKSKK